MVAKKRIAEGSKTLASFQVVSPVAVSGQTHDTLTGVSAVGQIPSTLEERRRAAALASLERNREALALLSKA